MKYKGLIIETLVIFFLVINTSYFWMPKVDLLGFFAFPALALVYLIFLIVLIRQIYLAIREHFRSKQRIFVIILLTITLLAIFLRPAGIIDFEKFSGKDVLIAEREGVANCMTTLKLKGNNKFVAKSICFGMTEIKGEYSVKGDTIFFDKVNPGRNDRDYYQYAIIKNPTYNNPKYMGDLTLFKNNSDTTGYELWIIKNELMKPNSR